MRCCPKCRPNMVDRVFVVTGDSTDGTDKIATGLGAAALPPSAARIWRGLLGGCPRGGASRGGDRRLS